MSAHILTILSISSPCNCQSDLYANFCWPLDSCPVRSPFIDIEDDTRSRLIESLGSWHFEPHKLPEEEVLACAYILFEAVFRIEGMTEEISVPLCKFASASTISRESQDALLLKLNWRLSCNISVNCIDRETRIITSSMLWTSCRRLTSSYIPLAPLPQCQYYLLTSGCGNQTRVPLKTPVSRAFLMVTFLHCASPPSVTTLGILGSQMHFW